MAVQDDRRENEIRDLFKLQKVGGRGDVDAILTLNGVNFDFELKSTTNDSVSTVRDLGPDHIKKWRKIHWIVGTYDEAGEQLQACYYASPAQMKPWVDMIEAYIKPDIQMAKVVSALIGPTEMAAIIGSKAVYTLEDAQRLQKKQHTKAEYLKLMDVPGGYSPARMLEIVRNRGRYIIERGSTLNNPHIPMSHFEACTKITSNHAARLRELVKAEVAGK